MEVRSLARRSFGRRRPVAYPRSKCGSLLADQVTPLRLASHLSVLAVAALILILSQIDIPTWEVSLRILPSQPSVVRDDGRFTCFRLHKRSGRPRRW